MTDEKLCNFDTTTLTKNCGDYLVEMYEANK